MPPSNSHQSDLFGGRVHLHKATRPPCPNGKCRLGPTIHLSKTATESHSAILHGLDRKVGRLYFGTDPFLSTIDAWNGTPLVFAQSHPEPRDFTKDPDSELDRINGAIIGEASDAFIEGTGHPKLMLTKNYTDETAIRMFGQGLITEEQLKKSQAAVPIALKLLAEGKLSHSSAFICPDDGEKLTGTVIPNHILEFEETERDQPVDRMAVVLSKQEIENVTLQAHDTEPAAHTNIGRVMSGKNSARLKGILDGISSLFADMMGTEPPAPQKNKTEGEMNTPGGEPLTDQNIDARLVKENKMTPEEQKLMDEKDAEITALKAKIAEMEGASSKTQKVVDELQATLKAQDEAKAQMQKAKFEADWANLEKTIIPAGEIKDPADKAQLQKMSVEDPLGFAAKLAGYKNAPKMAEEGTAHMNKGGDGADHLAASRELRQSTGRITRR